MCQAMSLRACDGDARGCRNYMMEEGQGSAWVALGGTVTPGLCLTRVTAASHMYKPPAWQ